ncbi:MAG: GH3 auxin-responsive promoter family protein [Lachnoclostridium sp.]|nr:GH3 auxin-responsive promoter family protein [Lachnoclostridium sp.]
MPRSNHILDLHENVEQIQTRCLKHLLHKGCHTLWGDRHGFKSIDGSYSQFVKAQPDIISYPDIRDEVMRMVGGEADILWPGVTRHFAQSSGTSDGKSKYIPITADSFKLTHYRGGSDVVAHYLRLYPESRLFSGKAFILGGSFANELHLNSGVEVGDLSANLIQNINPVVNHWRIPDKRTALMTDWAEKLPALVEASVKENITNISGVPSWFLTVLKSVIERAGVTSVHDLWPNLEVFFHGGISMEPYRQQYKKITDPTRMHYLETYNASEGFFAIQDQKDSRGLLLEIDCGIFYEFLPLDQLDAPHPQAIPAWEVEDGKIYAMIITSCNGLWRYSIGDTVKIESTSPLRISIAGRTKHFINAFGEELMVDNADRAIAAVSHALDCEVANYTAAPVYAGDHSKGRHEWVIEFTRQPADIERFADMLDRKLQDLNSDYQAKRTDGIFLDRLSIVVGRPGVFDRWLASTGKLGGQRKVPRLCNSRQFIEPILKLNNYD